MQSRKLRRNPESSRAAGKVRARGVALVAVLLLVAGLVAIATALVALSLSQRRAAHALHEAEVRREAIDGALRVALAEIAFGKASGPFWHPRMPRTVVVGGKRVEVMLERESGRIDLNTADQKYIVAGLEAAGLSETDARTGALRIQDWIDPDDAPSGPDGAEREAYRRAGTAYGPRNGPLEAVDEVRQVRGLGALSDELLDAFTVYSQQKEPFAAEALEATRKALSVLGMTSALPSAPPDANEPVSYAGSVIRLHACEEGQKDSCRVVVVRVTGSNRTPWLMMMWR
jgi:type II secretory pathway component PulK